MVRSSSVEAASGEGWVDQMSGEPTPQHHHKRIARVTHSHLAMLCEQGVTRGRGGEVLHHSQSFNNFLAANSDQTIK